VKTSKSPRRVLQAAYEAACRALPAHRHKYSPKKFTQPQLKSCLVLKEFSHLDYRGLAEHLVDHADLVSQIRMKTVPHFTTFQKAAQRLLLATPARKIFDAVLERALRDGVRQRRVPPAAVDGTGLESRTPAGITSTAAPAAETATRSRLTPSTRRSSSWSIAAAT